MQLCYMNFFHVLRFGSTWFCLFKLFLSPSCLPYIQ
uniref:Uncharacterized protein n=1 Tax=Rhizophora mucronata TaxID=61149 RepID=A0A2P2N0D7_RHIMU